MKIKALISFHSYLTNSNYQIGKEYEVTNADGKKLIAQGLASEIKEEKPKTTRKPRTPKPKEGDK